MARSNNPGNPEIGPSRLGDALSDAVARQQTGTSDQGGFEPAPPTRTVLPARPQVRQRTIRTDADRDPSILDADTVEPVSEPVTPDDYRTSGTEVPVDPPVSPAGRHRAVSGYDTASNIADHLFGPRFSFFARMRNAVIASIVFVLFFCIFGAMFGPVFRGTVILLAVLAQFVLLGGFFVGRGRGFRQSLSWTMAALAIGAICCVFTFGTFGSSASISSAFDLFHDTTPHRFAVIRVYSRGWFSSSSRGVVKYVADEHGFTKVVPEALVDTLDKWREGDSVVLPSTYPAWMDAGVVDKSVWASMVNMDTPVTLPDKSADLYATHVFAVHPGNVTVASAK